jgi:hypothetical protein
MNPSRRGLILVELLAIGTFFLALGVCVLPPIVG